MSKIKINKEELKIKITDYQSKATTVNTILGNLERALNSIEEHQDISGISGKGKQIATNLSNLSKDFKTEVENLNNYYTSVVEIDEKAPSKESIAL